MARALFNKSKFELSDYAEKNVHGHPHLLVNLWFLQIIEIDK